MRDVAVAAAVMAGIHRCQAQTSPPQRAARLGTRASRPRSAIDAPPVRRRT